MGARITSAEIIGIALVVRDRHTGAVTLYGSKEVEQATLEAKQEPQIGFLGGSYAKDVRYYDISARCYSITMQRGVPVPPPPQIEQRGIYLPDLSFRALPSPED